jgi:hypothetical protein
MENNTQQALVPYENLEKFSYEHLRFVPMPASITVAESDFSISYEDGNAFSILKNSISMVEIKNLSIKKLPKYQSSDLLNLELSRPTFLWSVDYPDNIPYYHLLYNILASFEAIKSKIPNIDFKIVGIASREMFLKCIDYLNSLNILEIYKITEKDLLFLDDYDSLNISSLWIVDTTYDKITSKIIEGNQLNMGDINQLNSWGKTLSRLIKDSVLSSSGRPSKIFISRLKENDEYRKIKNTIIKNHFKKDLSVDEKIMLAASKDNYESQNMGSRLLDRDEEILLEKLFEYHGYTVVNPGDLGSVSEQAKLFNSAKYVAGLAGAGFMNCLFCNSEAQVLVLNAGDGYRFPHDKVVESFGLKTFLCPQRMPWRPWDAEALTAQAILDTVKKNYPNFLDHDIID